MLGNLTLILGYCSYANLGILYSMNREYVLEKENSNKKAQYVINTTFTSLGFISILFILFSVTTIVTYKNDYGIYLSIIFIIAIFEQFKSFFVNYFRLVDNYNMINIIEIIYNVISFILTIGLLKIKGLKLQINIEILKNLVSIGIPLLIYNLGFYILTTIDRWIIIKYFSDSDLGYYTFANNMVSATLVFISSMLFLLYLK